MSPEALLPRILLVDDNADNLALMRLFLDSGGYRLDEAANGREAVDRFAACAYDLVFMDLEMPVLDGYAATRAIRALEEREHRAPTPILVLTAHVLDEFRERCEQAGCTDFLVKPVRKAAILSTLARFLGQAATEPTPPRLRIAPRLEDSDRERLRPLLPMFFATADDTLDGARRALGRGDLETARRQGHKLKGSALLYGFEDLGRAARALEQAGEAGNASGAAAALDWASRLLSEARQAG